MTLVGEVFAERPPNIPSKKRKKQADFLKIGCTEFGTLPREMIIRLGLRHVYTMPIVSEDKSTTQVFIYQAEVLWRKKWRTVYVQENEDEPDEGWQKYDLEKRLRFAKIVVTYIVPLFTMFKRALLEWKSNEQTNDRDRRL